MNKIISMVLLGAFLIGGLPVLSFAGRADGIQGVLPGISEAEINEILAGPDGTWTRKDEQLLQALLAAFPELKTIYTLRELKLIVKRFPGRIQNAINSKS